MVTLDGYNCMTGLDWIGLDHAESAHLSGGTFSGLGEPAASALVHPGVFWWCMSVVTGAEAIRRSISLPSELSEKIDEVAAARHVSANRAIVDLLRDAITAYEMRRTAFLELADRFQKSKDPVETKRLREELAKMTFGH